MFSDDENPDREFSTYSVYYSIIGFLLISFLLIIDFKFWI